jgi:hypothetical protein
MANKAEIGPSSWFFFYSALHFLQLTDTVWGAASCLKFMLPSLTTFGVSAWPTNKDIDSPARKGCIAGAAPRF